MVWELHACDIPECVVVFVLCPLGYGTVKLDLKTKAQSGVVSDPYISPLPPFLLLSLTPSLSPSVSLLLSLLSHFPVHLLGNESGAT